MATQYDLMKSMETTLKTDVNLTTWLTTTFGKALTVILGNRQLGKVKPTHYPVAIIVFEPEEVDEPFTGDPHYLKEIYHIELGLHFAKATEMTDTHLQHLAEFERLAALALMDDRKHGGLALGTAVAGRIGDGNVNHPFHFFGIKLRIERNAPY